MKPKRRGERHLNCESANLQIRGDLLLHSNLFCLSMLFLDDEFYQKSIRFLGNIILREKEEKKNSRDFHCNLCFLLA